MRLKITGNRLYRCFRVFPNSDILWVVARDNAHARRIVLSYISEYKLPMPDSFAVSWFIYDANGGITSLPIGSVIRDSKI
jgi:hypothetical protein